MEYLIAAVVGITIIILVIHTLTRTPVDDDAIKIVIEDKPLVIPAEALHQIPVHRVIKAKLTVKKKTAAKKPAK